jgi:4-phospho-D-threonate 3-dehydrogenase / 4-phospho-D-erythronate 3-dehydrogenase
MTHPGTAPRLAITLGDPAGIGPEIVVKALIATRHLPYRPLLVGSRQAAERAADAAGLDLRLVDADAPLETVDTGSPLQVGMKASGPEDDVTVGVESAEGGESAWQAIQAATAMCLDGRADAMVTAPLNKLALEMAGRGSTGHTEILQELTSSPWSLTMFVLDELRALFYSRHLSLRDAIDRITADGIVTVLERFASVAPSIGLDRPRIAVAALNPHGGEAGLFGREEIDHIQPAVQRARAAGMDVSGPVPSDAVYALARSGRYDVVLGMYHDQVSGSLKSIDFHGTVSVTLGLPFLRFSVDHGTAFDIAGQNRADAGNMIATIERTARFLGSSDRSDSGRM